MGMHALAEGFMGGWEAPFDFRLRTRMVFGDGVFSRLGALAADFEGRRVLLVSDPGIVAAGHVARGVESLRQAGMETLVFDGASENPTTDDVERGRVLAADFRPDLLVGLGGGSSMDCAKGINFLHTNGGQMQDYWGVGKAKLPMLPMIAVPTTAGTGSEMQSFALISDSQTHVKMACGDSKAACRVALLDPSLTLTQPTRVTALTGVDAVSHAVETFVTRPRNTMSLTFSFRAWALLTEHLPRVLREPSDLAARGGVQLGAALAGLAIENSMLGAAHALANPLTASFGVPHGQAVGVMLPSVVRFNAQLMGAEYSVLESVLPVGPWGGERRGGTAGETLARWLEWLLEQAGLATRLHVLGVDSGRLEELAAGADRQWTKGFNPVSLDAQGLLGLYRNAF